MKKLFFMTWLLALMISEVSKAACGPPECCNHPHICGKGPEIESFLAIESDCLQQAAASVDGKIYLNPAGYPHSIRNDWQQEMAQVNWSNNTCTVKYSKGFYR